MFNYYKFLLAFTCLFWNLANKKAANLVFPHHVLGDSSYLHCVQISNRVPLLSDLKIPFWHCCAYFKQYLIRNLVFKVFIRYCVSFELNINFHANNGICLFKVT